MAARAEQAGDLVIPVGYHCFLKCNDVRLELAQAVNEDRPTLVPHPVAPPQIERDDTHHARAEHLLHPEPPESPISVRKSGSSIAARTGEGIAELPRPPL